MPQVHVFWYYFCVFNTYTIHLQEGLTAYLRVRTGI